jgi:ribosomal protein L3 glutamine methyltransferase
VSRFREAGVSFGHGTDNAWDEAVYLVLTALHLPADELDPYLEARLLPGEIERVLALIERRAEHVPAAYLTHEAWLGDMSFYVDERVIVPRSFIAELLFENLAPWVEDALAVTSVLDLCTGSGCLAIIAARQFPQALIDAVDVSPDALAVARINVERHAATRVTMIESDLFAALSQRRYQLIVCNPPYVPNASMDVLPDEYRAEPDLALRGGADGLDIVRRIVAAAPLHLDAQGLLVIEVGNERAAFEDAFPELACTWLATEGSEDAVVLIEARDLPRLGQQ